MTEQVTPRFKAPKNPNRNRVKSWRDRRDGMSEEYLAAIRQLPSCVSFQSPVHAHHLQIKEERGIGLKATDKWAVPLTEAEHRSLHRFGSRREIEWFSKRGIDSRKLAAELWSAWSGTRDLQAMYRVLLDHFHDPRRP